MQKNQLIHFFQKKSIPAGHCPKFFGCAKMRIVKFCLKISKKNQRKNWREQDFRKKSEKVI